MEFQGEGMRQDIALVTGGTGGIGAAICRELGQQYKVIACYYKNGKHQQAREWQESQKDAGYDVDILYGNLSSYADCESMINLVLERYERIGVLVNNAGNTADTSLKPSLIDKHIGSLATHEIKQL
jgi:acetoacetyl-CoA reductase